VRARDEIFKIKRLKKSEEGESKLEGIVSKWFSDKVKRERVN
jgi:hypothetical protein